jgi:hypothetical protein
MSCLEWSAYLHAPVCRTGLQRSFIRKFHDNHCFFTPDGQYMNNVPEAVSPQLILREPALSNRNPTCSNRRPVADHVYCRVCHGRGNGDIRLI